MLTRSTRRTLQLTLFLSLCFVISLSPALSEETVVLDTSRLVSGEFVVDRSIPGLFGGALHDGFRYAYVNPQGAVFDLGREFESLEFRFGMPDDGPGRDTEATIAVFGDGKSLGSFTHARGKPPVAVSIGVQGVRALKLLPAREYRYWEFIGGPLFYVVAATDLILRKGPPAEPKSLEVENGQVITLEAGTYTIVVKGVVGPTTTTMFGTPGGRALPVDPRDIGDLAGKLKGQVSADPVLGGLLSSGEKVQVAVAPFLLIPNDLSATVSATVTELLSTELIKSGAFKLIERAQLDKVLEELGFQQTGVVDPETAKEIGKLTGAATVMVGSVIDQGTYAVITCRLINTETGEAAIADSVELRK